MTSIDKQFIIDVLKRSPNDYLYLVIRYSDGAEDQEQGTYFLDDEDLGFLTVRTCPRIAMQRTLAVHLLDEVVGSLTLSLRSGQASILTCNMKGTQ